MRVLKRPQGFEGRFLVPGVVIALVEFSWKNAKYHNPKLNDCSYTTMAPPWMGTEFFPPAPKAYDKRREEWKPSWQYLARKNLTLEFAGIRRR